MGTKQIREENKLLLAVVSARPIQDGLQPHASFRGDAVPGDVVAGPPLTFLRALGTKMQTKAPNSKLTC